MMKNKVTRKKHEREAQKQEVLDFALALFAERGFHDVSVKEIAAATEYSVGTLYNLFENKKALFDEMMESTKERLLEDLVAVLEAPGDAVQRIRTFVQEQPDLLEEYVTFIKLYVAESRGERCKAFRMGKGRLNDVINSKLSEIIAEGISKGLFRLVDPLITAQALIAVTGALAFDMAGQFDTKMAIDKFTKVEQLFVDGLLVI